MAIIDIKVPDIGDFAEVAIIEVLVKPGDTIKAEQSLITVESDKASMEIPSSHAGVVKELKVKLGDKVAEGTVVLTLEVQGAAAPAPAPAPAPAVSEQKTASAPAVQAPAAPKIEASSFGGTADLDCDVLVLGGGPGGYSAAFRAADLGLKVVIVERYAQLGGVCLNVGCIPSKALLHVAAVMDEVSHMADLGVDFGAPSVNVDKLRGHKEKVIGKLTGGLAATTGAGIAGGCIVAGLLCRTRVKGWVVRVGAWGLAGTLCLLAIPGDGLGGTLLGFWGTGATLATVGLFAGFFSVPLQVYLQAKTPSEQKGRIIGAMNLMNWIGICLSSAIYGVANLVLVKTARLPHASVFAVAALLIVPIALFYRPPNLVLQTTDPPSSKNSPDRA